MTTVAGSAKKILGDEVDSNDSLHGISLSLLSSEAYEPTLALQYVNSQLVAHGFARSPGLSLEGLAINDSARLVKCLLSMLSQRVDDLSRTEEQGSKLRTLTYEHERLQSMHRTAVDNSANAEREMNLFKSRLTASQRSLTSEVSAHKQTLSELQRTRTSLQYLRSTCQNELKRKDKEVERVLDRWNKICDAQVKLGGAQSGLRCANYAPGVEQHPRGKVLMEEALEQAEEARSELVKENEGFRSVILCTANALQTMIYYVMGLGVDSHVEEPASSFSHEAVFSPPTSSLSHSENAYVKIRELVSTFRKVVSGISKAGTSSSAKASETEEEISKLKDQVTSLRNELDNSRQTSNHLVAQAQEVLERFTTHASERLVTGRDPTAEEAAEMSMELIGVLERDDLRDKLERRTRQLEAERVRFTEVTLKLGKEKAALEAERLNLSEEKRRWAVERMLAELPSTPGSDSDPVIPPLRSKTNQLLSPPRVRLRNSSGSRARLKSPVKKAALMRHIPGYDVKPDALSLGKKLGMRKEGAAIETVEVLYQPDAVDTGLGRSTTPEDSPPLTQLPTLATEMKMSLPLVLPTTFTLPPPSPASSLAVGALKPIISKPSAPSQAQSSSNAPDFDAIPLTKPARHAPAPFPRSCPSPRTPRPLANSHLKHAYSPARPSPLSRILLLADSPPSPPPVPPIQEENESADDNDDIDVPALKSCANIPLGVFAKGNLAQELKLDSLFDEPSPLRERTGGNLDSNMCPSAGATTTLGNGTLMNVEEKRFTAREKGKARAVSNGITPMEKENVVVVIQGSRTGTTKRIASSNTKPSKFVVSETRNATVLGKPSIKSLPTTGATSRNTASSGPPPPPLRPQGGISQPGGVGMAGVTLVRHSGRTKRVPGANTAKLDARKV